VHVFQLEHISLEMLKKVPDSALDQINLPIGARALLQDAVTRLQNTELKNPDTDISSDESISTTPTDTKIKVQELLDFLSKSDAISPQDKEVYVGLLDKLELQTGDLLELTSTLKKDPKASLEVLTQLADWAATNTKDINGAYKSFKASVQGWREQCIAVSEKIERELGLSGKELILYASSAAVLFLVMAFFIFWGFSSIQKSTLGLGVIQSVLIALVGLVSKLISDAKKGQTVSGDPALRKEMGNKVAVLGKAILQTWRSGGNTDEIELSTVFRTTVTDLP